jgi:methanesulfonate monooxygenase subunit beta
MLDVRNAETLNSTYREIAQLIYDTVLLLDAKDFSGWLDRCADDFAYAIRSWSPELRAQITWLEHDRAGIENLVHHLPRHHTEPVLLTRHATVYRIEPDAEGDEATAITALTIYHTQDDGGETSLFAVGRYYDRIIRTDDGWRLREREVELDTRSLGIGTQYPL